MRSLLLVGSESTSEAALAEVVLNGALLGGSGLGEGDGAAKWAGKGTVLELGNAGVGGASDGAGAGHASWHLDGDGEVHGLCCGETTDADTWDILGNSGCELLDHVREMWKWRKLTGLECGDISSSGCGVNHCGQWSSTILVDLVEGHGESSIISGGWETR